MPSPLDLPAIVSLVGLGDLAGPGRAWELARGLAFVAAGLAGAYAVHRGLRWLGERTAESRFRFDGVLVRVLSRPLAILVALLGLVQGLRQLEGLADWITAWPGVEAALGVLAATWVVAGLVRETVEVYGRPRVESTETDFDDRLLGIVDLAATLVIWIVGGLLALHALGVQITPVLASMGVAGLAVALAVRTILGNFFGGLVVTADPYVQPGHRIRVGDWRGDVVDVGRYKTTIRTPDNLLVSIPNEQLMKETVVNDNLPASRTRIEMEVAVAYGTEVEAAEQILLDIASDVDGVLEEPAPEANVAELGDNAIVLQVLAWQRGPRGRRRTRDQVYRRVLRRFREEDVEIPYPRIDVDVRSEPPA